MKECLFALMVANARTGQRMEGCSDDESRVLGEYGRDARNDNGDRLRSFATSCKLALTNTFFSTRKGGILHTHNGTNPNDPLRRVWTLSSRWFTSLSPVNVTIVSSLRKKFHWLPFALENTSV